MQDARVCILFFISLECNYRCIMGRSANNTYDVSTSRDYAVNPVIVSNIRSRALTSAW